jgi:hypothetical protein
MEISYAFCLRGYVGFKGGDFDVFSEFLNRFYSREEVPVSAN